MQSYEKFGNQPPTAPPPPYGLTQPVAPFMHGSPHVTTVNMPPPPMVSNVTIRGHSPNRESCCCCCTCPFWVCGLFFLVLIGIPILVGLTQGK